MFFSCTECTHTCTKLGSSSTSHPSLPRDRLTTSKWLSLHNTSGLSENSPILMYRLQIPHTTQYLPCRHNLYILTLLRYPLRLNLCDMELADCRLPRRLSLAKRQSPRPLALTLIRSAVSICSAIWGILMCTTSLKMMCSRSASTSTVFKHRVMSPYTHTCIICTASPSTHKFSSKGVFSYHLCFKL